MILAHRQRSRDVQRILPVLAHDRLADDLIRLGVEHLNRRPVLVGANVNWIRKRCDGNTGIDLVARRLGDRRCPRGRHLLTDHDGKLEQVSIVVGRQEDRLDTGGIDLADKLADRV